MDLKRTSFTFSTLNELPQIRKAGQHAGALPSRLGAAVQKLVAKAQFVGTQGLGADVRNRVIVAVAHSQSIGKVEPKKCNQLFSLGQVGLDGHIAKAGTEH